MRFRFTQNVLSAVFLASIAVETVYGVTFDGQRATKINPGTTSCTDPPGAVSFLTTDNTVYLYFNANVDSSDKLSVDWVAPDGSILQGGNWGSGYSGYYCFTGISLTTTSLAANRLGGWRARIWNNGAFLFPIPFHVDAPSGNTSSQTADTSHRTLPTNLNDNCYQAPTNRFDQNDGMQCTRYAWGRACEKTGIQIKFSDEDRGGLDGGNWYSRSTGLILGSSPRPNSIAVWSDRNGGPGHVAFVEEVDKGDITISEANFSSYPNARYDNLRTLAAAAISPRGNLTLLGYIYLTPYEGYVDGSSGTCASTIGGWAANKDQLNTPLSIEFFDGEMFLGSMLADAWRQDVGTYLGDNGNHAFSYILPDSVKDGQKHTIWARAAGSYTDLINTQSMSCIANPGPQAAYVQISMNPTYVTPSPNAACNPSYEFDVTVKETSGVGVNLSKLSLSEGWSWSLPFLGIPNRLDAYAEVHSGIVRWCRGTGTSTWTVTGTDDKGNSGTWSGSATFALQ